MSNSSAKNSKYSDAGKGDKRRDSISPTDWGRRWDAIFKKKKKLKK